MAKEIPETAPRGGEGGRLGLLVGLALLVWVSGSLQRSLWGDEFHSMHHVLTEDLGAFLASVRDDNHPPLSFFLERLSVGAFGLSDLALRLPSMAVGVLVLLLLARFGERHGGRLGSAGPAAARLAPWFVVGSSYCFVILTEARMYPLLLLASLGLLAALLAQLQREDGASSAGRWWLTLWIAVGLHAHYYFVHELAVAGLCVVAALALRLVPPRRVVPLIVPGVIGIALWVPWALYGFRTQLTHDLPPGGAEGTLATLVQSLAHFFFWNATLGGEVLVRGVAWPGSVLAGIALAVGAWRLARAWRADPSGRLTQLLVVGFGLGLPLWAWLVSQLFGRSTFGWRYVVGAAPPVFLLAALGVVGSARAARVLGVLLLASMTVVTGVNLVSGGREDHRRLVAFVLDNAREGDVVVVKPPWDPIPLRQETSWRYYLDRSELAPGTHVPPDVGYDELPEARRYARVWVWFRDPYYQWVRRNLAERFDREETWEMGPGMVLHLFSKSGTPR